MVLQQSEATLHEMFKATMSNLGPGSKMLLDLVYHQQNVRKPWIYQWLQCRVSRLPVGTIAAIAI